ncbi:hypothetical protein E1285_13240 [Actinomadura sp. 7K507]|nr:hypothetical protein E1285_13240 [Actinomadura sp. 7K507]
MRPLDPALSPEVVAWVSELRVIWAATGLSITRFAALYPIDKGSVSRYLNGQRVPRDHWFLEKLLAVQAENGRTVSPDVREHLTDLQLRALETAHPREYVVRLVSDRLELAVIGQREAERYARDLEEQLADRVRKIELLADDNRRLRTAWDADRAATQAEKERLEREIAELTAYLKQARRRGVDAERRCRELEELLNQLEPTVQEGEHEPKPDPAVWGGVPPRNRLFTGRDRLLEELRSNLAREAAPAPQVIHGMFGEGKTQLAVEYAHRYRSDYDVVWWIPADQPVLVRSALASLTPHLGLSSDAVSGVAESADEAVAALRKGEPHSRWLLVFDHADQPEDLRDLIPQGPGHVLITSRNCRWQAYANTVSVGVFTRDESVDFLTRRVPHGLTVKEAGRLAEQMGDLPLALEQAGALHTETGIAVPEYLQLLAQRTSKLLAEGRPSEYLVPMTAAYALSVDKLEERLPESMILLRLCAFFGPEPIPLGALSKPVPGLEPQVADLIADPFRLLRVVAELGRFGLARLDLAARTIQIHRLIQALVRDELDEGEHERLQNQANLLLAEYTSTDSDERPSRTSPH